MNPFTADMDALDRKAGHIHTVADWRRAREKAQRAPGTLTDADILIISYFDGQPNAERAAVQRVKAFEPPPLPASQPAPRATPTQADYLSKAFDAFGDAVIDVLKKALAGRDAKIATLESRVLELEASDAARVAAPPAEREP